MSIQEQVIQTRKAATRQQLLMKLVSYSAIGIVMFFLPVTLGTKTTIPIDHIVTGLREAFPGASAFYTLFVIMAGAVYSLKSEKWRGSVTELSFTGLKLLGMALGLMAFFGDGPAWLFEPDMLPFFFNRIVMPIGLIIPIGSVFLAFLINYGLLELVGVIMRPVMKPLFRTPGRSAIDAVGSFVGSYSIALLITNGVYREGKYSIREAAIIATGFSTVSATFMIIVAKTLDLMDHWLTFFWVSLILTFAVTAVTARIWPLSRKPQTYCNGMVGIPESSEKGNILKRALNEGMDAAAVAPGLLSSVRENLRNGLVMAMGVLPTVLAIGILGAYLAKYTPVFDWLGMPFIPLIRLLGLPDATLIAKSLVLNIADMSLPLLIMQGTAMVPKFIIANISISTVLFLSASIPCVLSTDIPLTFVEIMIIALERTVIGLILITPVAYMLF
ncbi:YjiH family protein [Acidaminobacter hydrogenoformans]|uniref:Nucleoside recognition GATE domain-containing membrane protein YjiH n=1 Tax=Acidaminobacter hydrogenoformans DSM 2784 TaxID=1120920 RepID=A0A1G5RYY6_9FIRM|nr:YjiH family protein [Acidaminobacter hydrogenoformans]SCZ79147.1 nucleoside recognition GATE domain-containing membrane protein YjiH [Acidaminobacter hydrogenoformans DSM 2784]